MQSKSFQGAKIQVIDASKRYVSGGKAVLALSGINLAIQEGDVYGIIGLSGAGKSTLIRSLTGLIPLCEGKILFDGEELGKMSALGLRAFRLRIGMIFQHFNLLQSRTVRENISYPLEIAGVAKGEREERIERLLDLVGLKEKGNAYPETLSGGEKQRVGIARALALSPEVLFCDEATSALDPKTTREILRLLKRVNRELGVTIVLITHDMGVIKEICTRVAVIEGGKIVEEGDAGHLLAHPTHPTTCLFLSNPREVEHVH